MKPDYFSLNSQNITNMGPLVTAQILRIQSDSNKVLVHSRWQNYIVNCHKEPRLIGRRSTPLCPLRYCLFSEHHKFEMLLIIFRHWTVSAELTGVIFHTSKDKYTSFVTDSINCQNCTFLHFTDCGSRSTSEIWKVAHCLGALNRDGWNHVCDISQVYSKLIWLHS